MVEFNEKLPVWLNDGIEPPKSKQTEGWLVGDKPPAAWFNWLHTRTYKSIEELREVAKQLGVNIEEIDVTDELASLKTAIERKLKETETNIEKVDNKTNTNKSDITGLRTRVSINERDIAGLKETKADIDYVDKEVAKAGKVHSVNNKTGHVTLTGTDIKLSNTSNNSIYLELSKKAKQTDLDNTNKQVNENKSNISTNKSNINKNSKRIDDSIKIVRNEYIYSSSWSSYDGEYRARVTDGDITSNSIVDMNIHLDYLDNAEYLYPVTDSHSGGFYIYSKRKPSNTIKFDYKVIKEV